MEWFYRHGDKFVEHSSAAGTFAKLTAVNEEKGTAKALTRDKCRRCGGLGGSEAWKMTGYTCYRCNGGLFEKTYRVPLYSAKKLARLNELAERRLERKLAKEATELAANTAKFKSENGYLFDMVEDLKVANVELPHVLTEMMMKACRFGEMSDKAFNYANLMVKWRLEELDKVAGRNKMAAMSDYVGEPKERLRDVTAELVALVRLEDRYYGYKPTANYMVKLRDADNNVMVYFGSSCPTRGYDESMGYEPSAEVGDMVTFAATVKEHSEYKGEKNTRLMRPKWSNVEPVAEVAGS